MAGDLVERNFCYIHSRKQRAKGEEIFMKGIKGLWRLRHLGKSPMRILRGNTSAGVFGIGDNGLEAVNRLIKRGVEDVNYLVLRQDPQKLAQTKADTIAMKDESWKGIEGFLTAPFDLFSKSFQKFQLYYNMNLQAGQPIFVLADLSGPGGREAVPTATRDIGRMNLPAVCTSVWRSGKDNANG